jgi:predicted Zn-dependent peptidase
MIDFKKNTLDNGLTVISHYDNSSPFISFNLLYKVGARNENPEKTGFAHLFEHLMFGGTEAVPDIDGWVQKTGGSFNAFTNNDYTNYYFQLPKQNIETAFWLDSDRMKSLAFTPKSLDVQRSVVIEEFKQRYLNQPYGDLWLLMRPLAYKKHPYLWATIGKELSHIEQAEMEDVKDFFFSYYAPNNAILTVVGDISHQKVMELSQKWFANIERRNIRAAAYEMEATQTEKRTLTVEKDIPHNVLLMAFHMSDRYSRRYDVANMISDILSNGESSRFHQRLVKEKKLFSAVSAYILGSLDAGLFVVKANLLDNINMDNAEAAIWEELNLMRNSLVDDYEMEKVKNRLESMLIFEDMNLLNKAMELAYFEMIGDAALINKQVGLIRSFTPAELKEEAKLLFQEKNCSVLYYLSKKASDQAS